MSLDVKNTQTKIFDYDDTILAYWQSIKNCPIPDVDEELELYKKTISGDNDAKSKLIMGHQRFIFAMAKQYAKTCDELIDYCNEGTIGLVKAIDMYDPSRGFRFLTFASYYIRREMNLYMRFINSMVYSGNRAKYESKLKEINKQFFKENGFYPSFTEICEIFKEKYDITVKNVGDLYDILIEDISFNADENAADNNREKEFNNATRYENLYEKDVEDEYLKDYVNKGLCFLSERERDVIKMLFGIDEYTEPYTTADVAYKLNITTASVNNIKNSALEKLRRVMSVKLVA